MAVDMKQVHSSNIDSIGYDPDQRQLHVKFKDGSYYTHDDVSPEKHQALMNADSLGKHFAANIRGKHKATKQES